MPIVGSTQQIGEREVTILVEVDELPEEAGSTAWGPSRTDRARKVMEATRDVFGEGLALARDCAARAVAGLDGDPDVRPDSFEIQLAIKLDAEAGAVLAKMAAGAQMQVTMRWDR